MTFRERSLVLVSAVNIRRAVCALVLAETGGLLPDDECVVARDQAERALTEHDQAAGYDRFASVHEGRPE